MKTWFQLEGDPECLLTLNAFFAVALHRVGIDGLVDGSQSKAGSLSQFEYIPTWLAALYGLESAHQGDTR
jgi:hypothetical protein